MIAPAKEMLEAETVEIRGGVLSTVTLTAGDVAVLPAASRATAAMVWAPSAPKAVFQETA